MQRNFELIWEDMANKKKKIDIKADNAGFIKKSLLKVSEFQAETLVIKLSADIIENKDMLNNFASNVAVLKNVGSHIVIVHDYSVDLVANALEKYGISSRLFTGSKIADHTTTKIFEMVLCGLINKEIISALNATGINAIGISGKDANLIEARKYRVSKQRPGTNLKKIIDLGFVGEPVKINPESLLAFDEFEFVTVISPVAYGDTGDSYILDPDLTSALMASVLAAKKLIIFSKEGGIKQENTLLEEVNIENLRNLMLNNKIEETMLSICDAAITAIENYTYQVNIIDSRKEDSLIMQLFSDEKNGTIIYE